MLNLLELPELIAQNAGDYVHKSLQYGRDKEANQALRAQLLARRDRLFDQQAPLDALTAFFKSLS